MRARLTGTRANNRTCILTPAYIYLTALLCEICWLVYGILRGDGWCEGEESVVGSV